MTTLNFFTSDEEAIVFADTRTTSGQEVPKMMALPHLSALVAGRGRYSVFTHVVCSLMNAAGSFEEAIQKLELLFAGAGLAIDAFESDLAASVGKTVEELRPRRAGVGSCDELLVVGWSEKEGRMHAVSLERAFPGGSVEVVHGVEVKVAPPDEGVAKILRSGRVSEGNAIRLVRAQLVATNWHRHPGHGGRLMFGRARRGHVSVQDLGAL